MASNLKRLSGQLCWLKFKRVYKIVPVRILRIGYLGCGFICGLYLFTNGFLSDLLASHLQCSVVEGDLVGSRLNKLRTSLHILSEKEHSLDRLPPLDISSGGKEIEKACYRYQWESQTRRPFLSNIWDCDGNEEIDALTKDVTLVTQMSLDRLFNLKETLRRWPGPVSVAIGLSQAELSVVNEVVKKFEEFQELLQRRHLSVHLVATTGSIWPTNYLRDIALNGSKTTFVFLNDVDFLPTKSLHRNARTLCKDPVLMNSQTALVVPAFEFVDMDGNLPAEYSVARFPSNKRELFRFWSLVDRDSTVDQFHKDHNKHSHSPTDYFRWRYSTYPYQVKYKSEYEPYIIAQKRNLPSYNSSIIGRFKDKISYILHLHAIGFQFKVVPQDFVMHVPHVRQPEQLYKQCASKFYFLFKLMLSKRHPNKVRVRYNESTVEEHWRTFVDNLHY